MESNKSHLGGYRPGGDPATYYPDLWNWFVKQNEVSSMLDIGCGEGHAMDYFEKQGCRVAGIDGVKQPNPKIMEHDFTKGRPQNTGVYDLVWSCEFLEHVEEQFLWDTLPAFRWPRPKYIAITHAFPGQAGHHHVNCRTRDYWIGVFAANGYWYDDVLTAAGRMVAGINRNPWNHFVRSGLIFVPQRH